MLRWQDDPDYEEKFRARVLVKIDPNKTCDAWIACRDKAGYGQVSYRGKKKKAHHAIWYLEYGYFPKFLLHSCDTPGCVNVNHLREGTPLDNMADKIAKGRQRYVAPHGENQGSSKLTETQVREIIALKGSGLLQRDIAIMYGIDKSQISCIQAGKSWAHLQ